MSDGRGSWYLLTGLLLGLVVGLVYGWLIDPVRYVDISPADLLTADKERYRALAAVAYQVNSDAGRTRARLALLGDANPALESSLQAERWLADPATAREGRALALLAALYVQPGGTAVPAASPTPTPDATLHAQALRSATPAPTRSPSLTPLPTFTPRTTLALTPTQGAPYVLREQEQVCQADTPGWLMVEVLDGDGLPVAGVRIQVSWEGGQDSFFTGLIPSVSPGYADFVMSAGTLYTVKVGEGGSALAGISIPDCLISSIVGGIRLKYQQ